MQKPGRHGSQFEDLKLTDEVVRTKEGNREFVDPKIGEGALVNRTGTNNAIRQKLSQFDPKVYYVQIFVWHDSFKDFVMIRKILVNRRFEYALIPMPKGRRVSIGPGRAHEVQ